MPDNRYFIKLAYKGTPFHGWQIQPNGSSVQQAIQDAMFSILGERIEVVGCGRTDTGVHASTFYAHFETLQPISNADDLKYKLNRVLPYEIAIYNIFRVGSEVHSRFSATSRTYRYVIQRHKDPFQKETAWLYRLPLDVDLMQQAANILFEFDDFTSFSKLHGNAKTNICKIMRAEVFEENGQLILIFQADRFLRNMVRALVGTLIEVGRHKMTVEGFRQIIMDKNRGKAGISVPPEGLFLVDVSYPEGIVSHGLMES